MLTDQQIRRALFRIGSCLENTPPNSQYSNLIQNLLKVNNCN